MPTDKEVMQQALDALDLVTDLTTHDDVLYEAIDALRERLAQPEPKPVGRFAKFTDGIWKEVTDGSAGQPLYTAQPKREWQSLTDAELWRIGFELGEKIPDLMIDLDFARAIEQALKEKNAL